MRVAVAAACQRAHILAMTLDGADLATARSALLFVRHAVAARRENTAALDRTLANFDATLATSANGSRSTPARHTGIDDEWVSTTEAATRLGCSERWAREIAPTVGGRKRAGRWWIPRSALPQEEP